MHMHGPPLRSSQLPTSFDPPYRPDLRRETRTPVLELVVKAPVGCVGSVYHAVTECRRLSEEFTADGSVVLRVAVEVAQVSVAYPVHVLHQVKSKARFLRHPMDN